MSSPVKRGLGRGLDALLGDASLPTSPAAGAQEAIRLLPLDRVRPNPHQPRKTFDETALAELQSSIAEHGVLVPVLVRQRGDTYELIAGERRWRACAALNLPHIPAIVRPDGDRESLEVAIVENLQRENLNPIEEAAGIADLIDAHDYTQEQVAARLGRSRPSITNALRLLGLPGAVKALIAQGKISTGHAKVLLGTSDGACVELAQRAAREGLSVRALERIVVALSAPIAQKHRRPARSVSPDDDEFLTRMRERFGAPVALRRTGAGGCIEIRFADESDLIRVAEMLLDRS